MIRAILNLSIPALFFLGAAVVSASPIREPVAESPPPPPAIAGQPHYDSLIMLLGEVCARSTRSLAGFFDSSPVQVRPFVHLGTRNSDSSQLGLMLADQMTAMLNGQANAYYSIKPGRGQRLEGILQEVDGYLRIHMLATNRRNQRRSHVAVLEMSPALYRVLHSQVDSW